MARIITSRVDYQCARTSQSIARLDFPELMEGSTLRVDVANKIIVKATPE
jgi:hypothetical protein